ncbi:sigma factor-like helix-turn-helix DNA-binding protein [Bradyrhizobium sp.]|uniref:sigma factor-like helix-turn-helix DNA-binding protein n=1 Tax=Bradyrhizobium sp. TaxID=376 RepID=UPI00403795BD
MVSDRNRQIVERRRSSESLGAIGSAMGISRERVRQIVDREERRDRRAQELEEAARLPQQPNPLQLTPRLRNMLAKLIGTTDFTPDQVVALEYTVAMFSTIPNFGSRDWKELKAWMERAGKSPAYQCVGGSRRSHDSRLRRGAEHDRRGRRNSDRNIPAVWARPPADDGGL